HIYDTQGRQLCCREKVEKSNSFFIASAPSCSTCNNNAAPTADSSEHEHSHYDAHASIISQFSPAIISFVILGVGLILDNLITQVWFTGWFRFIWYLVAYIPVGLGVNKAALESILRGNVFSEFFLMSIATIGAF